MIIALWAAPRSRSTALFRSMVEHGGLLALHEPFCNISDYGSTTVGSREVHTHAELIAAIRELSATRTVYFKDTTDLRYDAVLADREFLAEARHTFLIRRPDEIAASFYALKPDMVCSDIGLEGLYEMYQAVLAAGGQPPVVLDAADVVDAPGEMLREYCDRVGIDYRASATTWSSGERAEWAQSARWHKGVSESTGFTATSTTYADTVDNNEKLAAFSKHHEPFYELLAANRLVR
ncbi:sulfotransferase family protein [Lentzea sp. NPDC034063]|uniref:sulfotransferase-like domain-containing protein n=1 Tax=unclassified Lentzea TaxID=2643253 RepID=UPI0033DAEEE2